MPDDRVRFTNPYELLLKVNDNDLQAILKKKRKPRKAKKPATAGAEKENNENSAVADNKADKLINEKKVKFDVPNGKGSKQLEQPLPPPRSMKDTQNIRGNDNLENGSTETKGTDNNWNNREQKNNRFNRNDGPDGWMNIGGNRKSTFGNKNNENGNDNQDLDYNNQRERNDDRSSRNDRNDRNFGNRRGGEGQRRTFDGRLGKREFDRQSGSDKTGVKSIDKREGGGAHNWGTLKQDIEDLKKPSSDSEKDEGTSDEVTKGESVAEEPPIEKEKEATLFTFDEYKALQGERAKPQYNLRMAGEGEDTTKWKKMIALQNRKNEGASSEEEFEYDPTMYRQRVGLKKYVEIKFVFNDVRRGGFNRGPRGPRRDRREDDRNGVDNIQQSADRKQADGFKQYADRKPADGFRQYADRKKGDGKEKNIQNPPTIDDYGNFPSLAK